MTDFSTLSKNKLTILKFKIMSSSFSSNDDSKANLTLVIERLIGLAHEDLDGLNYLLQNSNPFTVTHELKCIETKRDKCLNLLQVLQTALSSEHKWGMDTGDKTQEIINQERLNSADKIMSFLREHNFIESSELAQYLKTTLLSEQDEDNECPNTYYHHLSKKERKLTRVIRKLHKVYNVPK